MTLTTFSWIETMSNLVLLVSMQLLLALAAISHTAVAAAGNATTTSPGRSRNTTALLPPFGANHTVGDGAGWFFDGKANALAANYSAWAANRTFYLGDYLIFKTRMDNTVVHTTNVTTYRLCGGGGSGGDGGWKAEEAFVTVMLDAEGVNYFFSDAGQGEHCRKGMRFNVTVAHGHGPPSVPPSYYEPLSGATAAWIGKSMWVAMSAAALLVL
ncbi:cucumber peeling cupredoxin [Brachypodium distachyon]|uniref:Phytocyanin domain-containing protein n=1 Tax=Brachypodium distachyon TaxID=15368 RepID=A0A2K2CNN6_BRADI|nr:cucumber peeling cupredoxin [Brachypodium distachyon]PNT63633.1 hypothetical protein BRADI_4g18980v3 [Brachypodium distachyon]|eukprot:XP_003577560.3 cucumber peeling cupredoxin [Brachypodium distachyon]